MDYMNCGGLDITITLDGSLHRRAKAKPRTCSKEQAPKRQAACDADSLLLRIRSLIADTWHRMQVLDLSPEAILSPNDYREAILVDAVYLNVVLIVTLADSVPYWVKTWLDDVDWDYIHELAECESQDARSVRESTWHIVCDVIPQLDWAIDEWFLDPDEKTPLAKRLPDSAERRTAQNADDTAPDTSDNGAACNVASYQSADFAR